MDPIVFIISLAILIFIHELGHFISAKKLGMYVEEFAIGFPPKVLSRKIKETVYSLNLIPIGGFVKIFGEQEIDVKGLERSDPDYKEKIKKAFYNQPSWKRIIVLLAGVSMNFVFGWLIISLVFVRGVAVPGNVVKIVEIVKDSPAEKAGLLENDKILTVAGEKISSSQKLIDVIGKNLGKEIVVLVKREEELEGKQTSEKQIKALLVPRKNPPAGEGAIGVVVSDFVVKKYSIAQAPWLGLKESVRISKFFYQELFGGVIKALKGEQPKVEVAGPLGIYSAYKETQGFFEKLLLTGLISLNLALINIFPFPALDGGHLLFIALEGVTRRKISGRTKQRFTIIGMLVLLGLVALVTVKDILVLINGH